MKRFKLLLLITALLTHFAVTAQTAKAKTDDIVFLLRQKEHVTQAVKTIQFLKEPGSSTVVPGKSVIIICGELVKELVAGGLAMELAAATEQGVDVYGCGLSLQKFGLDKSKLPPSAKYTHNGLVMSLELQKAGYLSVEL